MVTASLKKYHDQSGETVLEEALLSDIRNLLEKADVERNSKLLARARLHSVELPDEYKGVEDRGSDSLRAWRLGATVCQTASRLLHAVGDCQIRDAIAGSASTHVCTDRSAIRELLLVVRSFLEGLKFPDGAEPAMSIGERSPRQWLADDGIFQRIVSGDPWEGCEDIVCEDLFEWFAESLGASAASQADSSHALPKRQTSPVVSNSLPRVITSTTLVGTPGFENARVKHSMARHASMESGWSPRKPVEQSASIRRQGSPSRKVDSTEVEEAFARFVLPWGAISPSHISIVSTAATLSSTGIIHADRDQSCSDLGNHNYCSQAHSFTSEAALGSLPPYEKGRCPLPQFKPLSNFSSDAKSHPITRPASIRVPTSPQFGLVSPKTPRSSSHPRCRPQPPTMDAHLVKSFQTKKEMQAEAQSNTLHSQPVRMCTFDPARPLNDHGVDDESEEGVLDDWEEEFLRRSLLP